MGQVWTYSLLKCAFGLTKNKQTRPRNLTIRDGGDREKYTSRRQKTGEGFR